MDVWQTNNRKPVFPLVFMDLTTTFSVGGWHFAAKCIELITTNPRFNPVTLMPTSRKQWFFFSVNFSAALIPPSHPRRGFDQEYWLIELHRSCLGNCGLCFSTNESISLHTNLAPYRTIQPRLTWRILLSQSVLSLCVDNRLFKSTLSHTIFNFSVHSLYISLLLTFHKTLPSIILYFAFIIPMFMH